MAEDGATSDVTRVSLEDGREVVLVGTAHISRESVEVVQTIVAEERPDVVCVELDEPRFQSLKNPNNWENLDLKEVIRQKQVVFLVSRLALAAFQKRMGSYTGVKPGAEMLAAVEQAEACGAEVVLCDRDVKATLLRAWRRTPWWKKGMLMSTMLFGVFERNEVSEEDLKELREQQNIGEILDELGEAMPEVKEVVVDERDLYMAHQIRQAQGQRIVAVVGAAHMPGILRCLAGPAVSAEAVAAVEQIPPRSRVAGLIPWLITLVVLGLFAYGFYRGFTEGDFAVVKQALVAWVLANGLLSALGAAIALAHPLAIVTAFLAAPLTSLNPSVGAGMPTALVQVYLASPKVRDIERVGDDIIEVRGWWTNRLTRVLLVFLFSSLGSAIGTFVAFGWLKNVL